MNRGGLHLYDSVVYGISEYSNPFQGTVKLSANSATLGGALFLEENCPALEIMTGNCFCRHIQLLRGGHHVSTLLIGLKDKIVVSSNSQKTWPKFLDLPFTKKYFITVCWTIKEF